jgi:hypothetical protein
MVLLLVVVREWLSRRCSEIREDFVGDRSDATPIDAACVHGRVWEGSTSSSSSWVFFWLSCSSFFF